MITHRLTKVLRFRSGDTFVAFNETRQRLLEIKEIGKKEIVCQAKDFVQTEENNSNITLIFSPIKNERMRFFIEKCTEIGVKKFIPVIFARTVIDGFNYEKIKKYAISAAEQSGRYTIPIIDKIIDFKRVFPLNKQSAVLFCNEKETSRNLSNFSKQNFQDIQIIIGPEGGFSDQEKSLLLVTKNVQSISLGKNILRSETAAIVASSYCSFL